jgi:acetyl-CoA acetyltransferase
VNGPARHLQTPITVEDVLNSRMIAYPFRLLQCCLATDGGGALIAVSPERQQLLRHTGERGCQEMPLVSAYFLVIPG